MESQLQQQHEQDDRSAKLKVKPKFSLEKYIAFVQSRDENHLTVGDINQIISMHSFKKIYRRKDALEALSVIEVIDPSRSTLNENISSHARISYPQVIKDITDLGWQECCVTSIKTFNSIADYGSTSTTTATVATTANTTNNDKSPSKVDKAMLPKAKEGRSRPQNKLLRLKGPDVSGADGLSTDTAGLVDDATNVTDHGCAANSLPLPSSSSCCSSAINGAGETTLKKRRKKGIYLEAKKPKEFHSTSSLVK